MGKIISLVNQKGGVGKTTTSINLAASLGLLDKKVLLVDLDPQGNSTTGVGVEKGALKASIYDALNKSKETNEVIKKTKFKNLDLMPANINLAGLDIEFINMQKEDPTFVKGAQLKRVLESVKDNSDFKEFVKFSDKFIIDTDNKTSGLRPLWEKGDKNAKIFGTCFVKKVL